MKAYEVYSEGNDDLVEFYATLVRRESFAVGIGSDGTGGPKLHVYWLVKAAGVERVSEWEGVPVEHKFTGRLSAL